VRGCIYLVPSAAVPDLSRSRRGLARADREGPRQIGKTLAFVEALAPAVLAHAHRADDPRRDPQGVPRRHPSFGDPGKKVGLSSPLPLALRLLEFAGEIERTLDGGKLDSERYLWRRPRATLARRPGTTMSASRT